MQRRVNVLRFMFGNVGGWFCGISWKTGNEGEGPVQAGRPGCSVCYFPHPLGVHVTAQIMSSNISHVTVARVKCVLLTYTVLSQIQIVFQFCAVSSTLIVVNLKLILNNKEKLIKC